MKLEDGTNIYLQSFGEGANPLIILHGGPGGDSRPFALLAEKIPGQVIIYDHRGMGQSDRSSKDKWNLDQWARDLGEIVDQFERPIVMGQSFGGFVALTYAIDNSDKLAGLILSSTAARPGREEALAAFKRAGGEEAEVAAQAFFEDPASGWDNFNRVCAKYYNNIDRGPMQLDEEMLIYFQEQERMSYDLSAQLDKITCPTWIITGENDPITPPTLSREMATQINGPVKLDIVDNAGHGVYRDQRKIFLDLLENWRQTLKD